MAIETKAEIERQLTKSAERLRKVRETASALKEARQITETESAQRSVALIKPDLSPLRKD